ncbi:palmitoyltransferase ZDHHC21 isoform X2 [Amia ocellicauda]|uniref:palmitoyltransferase ZDHHC21 isoform X2 n=1 Tax=Amia ocellicauda TaxID=2972642 RepID=UPI003463EA16
MCTEDVCPQQDAVQGGILLKRPTTKHGRALLTLHCGHGKRGYDEIYQIHSRIPSLAPTMGLRIHFVIDPMGWCCISMVFFIWLYNSLFIPRLVLFPHFDEGHISVAVVIGYYVASLFCVTALVRASIADPGRLAQDPQIPHTEREQWELCNKCNMMRPKRSHHCSRCGHCVRRMDHHCPWINNCVGEDNHWLFLQLCFYTQVLSLFTLLLDFCQYYYFQPLTKVNEELFIFRHELALLRMSTFMGLLMFGGMSSLFYTQVTGILTTFSVPDLPVYGSGRYPMMRLETEL